MSTDLSPAPSHAPATVPVLLDTRECAALLRCSPKTLEMDRCRRRWQVPHLHIGRAVRYDREAVLQWLAAHNAPVDAA